MKIQLLSIANNRNNLILKLWNNNDIESMFWQLFAIISFLVLGWLGAKWLGKRASKAQKTDEQPFISPSRIRFLLFPTFSLLGVFLVWLLVSKTYSVPFLDLAILLLSSLVLVRLGASIAHIALKNYPWVLAFESFLTATIWVLSVLYIVGFLPEIIEALDDIVLTVGKSHISVWKILKALCLVAITVLVALWVSGLVEQRLSSAKGMDTSVRLVLMRIIKALLVSVAVLACLPMVGVDFTMLSVFGGALGVGLGFGFQKIAASYISGFILLLDRSLTLGNLVTVGEYRGIVTDISTRYTVLRALSGVEAIVPNELLVSSVVLNETLTDNNAVIHIPVQVSYETDLDIAMDILLKIGQAHTRVLENPGPKVFLLAFADSGIDLRLSVWVGDPQEGTQATISELNLEIWRRFKEAKIQIPFPQREIRILKDNDSELV